jgi:hypothetical protein
MQTRRVCEKEGIAQFRFRAALAAGELADDCVERGIDLTANWENWYENRSSVALANAVVKGCGHVPVSNWGTLPNGGQR